MQIDCLHIYENDEGWVVSVSVSALIERESLSVLVRRCFVFSLFWIVLRAESLRDEREIEKKEIYALGFISLFMRYDSLCQRGSLHVGILYIVLVSCVSHLAKFDCNGNSTRVFK